MDKVRPKRSYTTGSVPTTSDLDVNEIAISWADNKLFTKTPAGNIVSVTLGGGTDSVLRSLFTPAAPTSVTASAGNAQATVSWTAPTGTISQAPITDYVVQYSSNSGSSWTTFADGTSTATSATVTSLTNGTAYVFRAAAVNALGQGAWSSASSAVTPSAFSASAVILTSGTSYAVPSGASSMKVWAVGPGGLDGSAIGHAGAVCYKTWSVSGGQSISYSLGANATYESGAQRSGSTTVTFSGTTITAQGGGGSSGASSAASFSGGDGGATGGLGGGSYANWSGGAVGGNGTLSACGRYQATDVSGLFAAVTLAGGTVSETCGATAAFGSGGYGAQTSGVLYGIGGGGAWNQNNAASDNGGQGAVVISFS
jgi:Fibronectin type III domain